MGVQRVERFARRLLGLPAVGVAAALASVVGATLPSTVLAGTLGGEPPDFPNPGPSFTALAGTNTVDGALGPTPGDIQDAFSVSIPAGLHVTSVSYVGPSESLNLVGCGLTGTSNLNQTFNPAQTNCQLLYFISDGFSTEPQPWTVTLNAVDTTPPVLTVPANQTVEATGPTGATATLIATASDGADPTPTVACVPALGSTFPLGTTSVTCTATDDAGNTSSGSFNVTVVDTTAPTVTTPDQTIEATGPTGAIAVFTPTATDAVDATPTVVCVPASGSAFPLGLTPVSCTATDDAGNTSNGSFNVTVVDTTAPALTVPANQTVEATGPTGAIAGFTPTAIDAVDATPTVVCVPASGSTFPLGLTSVSCTATDDSGNTSSSGLFNITVVDTTDPALVLPGDTFASATGPGGAVVDYTVSATDIVDPSPTVDCSPAAGTTFPLGVTAVSCTATDDEGNSSSGGFDVTVLDQGLPVLDLPGDLDVEATGPAGAQVTFLVTATDDVDPDPLVVCDPASDTTFPFGATTVECTATDDEGNETAGSFTVTVSDTSPPIIDLPSDITAPASGPQGAIVTFEVTATDLVAGDVPVSCDPPSGSLFPIGTTTVTCTASDATVVAGFFGQGRFAPAQVEPGNVATGTFTVIVEPPEQTSTTTTTTTATTSPATASTSPVAGSSTTSTATTEPGSSTTSTPTTDPGSSTTTTAGSLPSTGTQPATISVLALVVLATGCSVIAFTALAKRHRNNY